MTESKFEGHTAGPWHANCPLREKDCTDISVREGERGDLIATVSFGKANAELIARAPDLLTENERLRAEVEDLKDTRATLLGEAVKNGVKLAELRKALGIIETWGGDYITGQSVYEFASAALARTKGEE